MLQQASDLLLAYGPQSYLKGMSDVTAIEWSLTYTLHIHDRLPRSPR